ncbi:TetR/AcrR family transcriptional regulator [Mycolicibacterium arseniciresistens]|uniref:TetR/AcrR family transcriptional regulator n=1 Tax=Mycolicibacterium arseniciresistens TaxID=3062257 RepID=A0ABT8U9P1_9MYCO|nr:TetR/AcrR family transcriptional regulator [Mycolicibacterium arseniciresistens]MDO3634501.1 TetR/AcrR family transcriptional regulator [Mycolicibacterium arseniciresistens]
MKRAESAAATRRALLDDAAALIDAGGPAAVTLREVGARAGLSRGAPYRHFADKESLLTAVAVEGWEHIGAHMQALRNDRGLSPADRLRAALVGVITLSRERPHLYRLMFRPPAGDPAATARAAQRMCDEFLAIVAAVVGDENPHRYAAIFLTGAHGAAGLDGSGLLSTDVWHTTAEELVDALLAMAAQAGRRD